MSYDDYDDPYYYEEFDNDHEEFETEEIDYDHEDFETEGNEIEKDDQTHKHPLSTWEEMAFLGGMAEELADVRRSQYHQYMERRKSEDYKEMLSKRKPPKARIPKAQSKYGDLIYIDSRGVGVSPPGRVIAIQEVIDRGYPILIDYVDRHGNYHKEITLRPKRIFERDGAILFETIEIKLLDLARVYFLMPLFKEKQMPVKKKEPTKDTSIIDLFYFLPNYDSDPFEYILEKFSDLSKSNMENPSQEIISLCKEIKREVWQPRLGLKRYKLLLDAVCEDIISHNPDLNPDVSIKLHLDESSPDNPGLSVKWQFEKCKED